MPGTLAAPPLQTSLVDPPPDAKDPAAIWAITRVWNQWFLSLTTQIQKSTAVQASVKLAAQTASIGATAFALGSVVPGVYRVSWAAHITTAASSSSSLTVTIGYTDGTIACTQAGSAITGNTTATVASGVVLLRSDSASAITYSTTYASSGGTAMQYGIDLILESVA